MIFCTSCGQQNEDTARSCVRCGAPFGGQRSSTPFTTAQPGAQQAGSQWSTGQPSDASTPYMQPTQGGSIIPGQKRDPIMVIILALLTCGIYAFWWFYTYATEMKNALGREDLNPTTDLLLSIVTCGLWGIYAFFFKYPQLFPELQRRVGLPANDVTMVTLLLGIFFSPAAIFIIQSELNKIWEAAGRR